MKRFWTEVGVVPADDDGCGGGWGITLDGRPVRTPARVALRLPTRAVADVVAGEWRAQGTQVDPRTMPATGFSNAAIDQVLPDVAGFAAGIAAYAQGDVLCYRADAPASLVERQAALWDPLLAWAATRFDVAFRITTGIVHVAQPPATIERLAAAIGAYDAYDAYALAALSPLVTIGGSLVTALALTERAITADAAFDATHADELWQVERWGEDAEATKARTLRKADFLAAVRYLDVLRDAVR